MEKKREATIWGLGCRVGRDSGKEHGNYNSIWDDGQLA